ncbi:membrane protein [Verticiella sediminum]
MPRRRLTPLVLVLAVCLAPVLVAVALYLNPSWAPAGAQSYGTLLEPQRPVPPADALRLVDLQGRAVDLRDERGQWLLLTVDGGACPESCARKLFMMRQNHASTGKNVVRIERVWLITDDAPVPDAVRTAYEGTLMLRADAQQVRAFTGSEHPENHIWIVDPLNNLMMRFPEDPDPIRMRGDLGKLLFASQVG